MRTYIDGIPVPRLCAWPKGKPFMMFRGKHHVLCARRFEYFCPIVRSKHFGGEVLYKILVLKILSIGLLMKILKQRMSFLACIDQSFPVPFGVAFIYARTILWQRSPGGNGEHTPVNEDSKLCFSEPLGYWPLI